MLLLAWQFVGALLHLVYQGMMMGVGLLVSGFQLLPTLFKGLYNTVMAAAPIVKQVAVMLGGWIYNVLLLAWQLVGALLNLVYQGCVMVLWLLASGVLFVIHLSWNTFVTVTSTTWSYTSSIASLLLQQGGYTIKEASKIDYGALMMHLREMYALIFMAFLVIIVTCILLRCQQNNKRRKRSVLRRENTEREMRPSIPQSRSQGDINATREAASDSVTSQDTELLRRRLHQANEELSQERDKSLCVVCLDATRKMLLKPCNHYCLCYDCLQGLRECPVCKRRIQTTEKIFHV